jgi:Asp/Glu/hydantoin racemase
MTLNNISTHQHINTSISAININTAYSNTNTVHQRIDKVTSTYQRKRLATSTQAHQQPNIIATATCEKNICSLTYRDDNNELRNR